MPDLADWSARSSSLRTVRRLRDGIGHADRRRGADAALVRRCDMESDRRLGIHAGPRPAVSSGGRACGRNTGGTAHVWILAASVLVTTHSDRDQRDARRRRAHDRRRAAASRERQEYSRIQTSSFRSSSIHCAVSAGAERCSSRDVSSPASLARRPTLKSRGSRASFATNIRIRIRRSGHPCFRSSKPRGSTSAS